MANYDIVDRFNPQNALTDNGAKGSPWFQRWLSNLGIAINPQWQSFTPVLTGAVIYSLPGATYRDRGNSLEVSIEVNVSNTGGNPTILIDSPLQYSAFGSISGAMTQDYTTYKVLNALYAPTTPYRIYVRMFDNSNFPSGFINVTLSGFFRKT